MPLPSASATTSIATRDDAFPSGSWTYKGVPFSGSRCSTASSRGTVSTMYYRDLLNAMWTMARRAAPPVPVDDIGREIAKPRPSARPAFAYDMPTGDHQYPFVLVNVDNRRNALPGKSIPLSLS